MQKPLPVSVCIISGAEAARIGRALESVTPWAAEIIVVLNEDAQDGTEEIARQYQAQLFREPWKGFVAQKNSAADKATCDWLLGLDADEVVSPELRDEINALLATPEGTDLCAAYTMPRLTEFCGRWIRHGDWYPDRSPRLWRRGRARWAGNDPDARLQVHGKTGRLKGHLLHYNAVTLDGQLAKIISYSSDYVRHALARNQRVTWWHLVVRPGWRFFRAYVIRLGFLDGWQGYYIAWMTAFHSVTRQVKTRLAIEARSAQATDRKEKGQTG